MSPRARRQVQTLSQLKPARQSEILKFLKKIIKKRGRPKKRKRTRAEIREMIVRQRIHRAGQKIRKEARKAGRPLARRRNLGPPGRLLDDVIIEVFYSINPSLLPRELSRSSIIIGIRQDVFNPLEQFMKAFIDINVPKDTGDLRRAIKRKIGEGEPTIRHMSKFDPFVVKIGTPGIRYAGPVNQMPTAWLKHPRRTSTNIGREGDPLKDPKAKHEWFNLLRLNGRTRAMKLWKDYLKNRIVPVLIDLQTSGLIKSAKDQAKRLFIVKFK